MNRVQMTCVDCGAQVAVGVDWIDGTELLITQRQFQAVFRELLPKARPKPCPHDDVAVAKDTRPLPPGPTPTTKER